MDRFQQQTAAFFTRMWLENAIDRDDLREVMMMSARMDELTLALLREEAPVRLTATGGRA